MNTGLAIRLIGLCLCLCLCLVYGMPDLGVDIHMSCFFLGNAWLIFMTSKDLTCCVEREQKKGTTAKEQLLTNLFDYFHFFTLTRSVQHSFLVVKKL